MNILQKIFNDYYEVIKYTLHPRDSEMENIDKMLNCGDPSLAGGHVCLHHLPQHEICSLPLQKPLLPTCGVKYSQERSTSMAFKLVNCTHRHCVFTIDEELRHFFLEDRSLLNCLFRAVQSVILHMFNKINKSQTLFLVLFVCFTLSVALLNGIHIFTVFFRKAVFTNRNTASVCHARLCAGSFYQEFDGSRTFLL